MADQPRTVSGTNRTGGTVSGGVYEYDGNLKRVKSVINGVTRYNVYDKEGRLAHVEEGADIATSIKTDYLHAAGMTLARIKDNVFTYMHPDHLGSASAGTDGNGAIAFTEFHTPFGEVLLNAAANDNQSDFTGHIRDTDIGMSYMQARYMDPNIGRFLSVDPVIFVSSKSNPGYFNRYSYTINEPINGKDLTGKFRVEAETANRYPKAAAIIKNKRLSTSKARTMSSITGASTERVNKTFTPGKGPEVKGEVMKTGDHGKYTNETGDLAINNKILFDVEEGVEGAAEFLEVVLEHEGTHDVDNANGIDTPGEEGAEYEIETYGKQIDADVENGDYSNAAELGEEIRDDHRE